MGHTAKHIRYRSILHYLVRKKGDFYGLHAEGYTNHDGIQIVKPQTSYYLRWSMLVQALGAYAATGLWFLTDDPFPEATTEEEGGKPSAKTCSILTFPRDETNAEEEGHDQSEQTPP